MDKTIIKFKKIQKETADQTREGREKRWEERGGEDKMGPGHCAGWRC